MLDSRYIHLHEALGLGAMWLKQGAKIIGQPENIAHAPNTPTSSVPPKKEIKNQENMSSARLALLQRVKSATLPQNAPTAPVVAEKNNYPTDTVEHYLTQLSGSIPVARVLAMSVCAAPADVAAGRLFSGADGELLRKMLAAIHLNLNDVFITSWLKDLPDFNPKPSPEAVLAASPRVLAEWQLSGAQALLLMGEFFERDDVQAQLPDVKAFIIPHPQRILNNPSLKRPAWETLQQLADYLANH